MSRMNNDRNRRVIVGNLRSATTSIRTAFKQVDRVRVSTDDREEGLLLYAALESLNDALPLLDELTALFIGGHREMFECRKKREEQEEVANEQEQGCRQL